MEKMCVDPSNSRSLDASGGGENVPCALCGSCLLEKVVSSPDRLHGLMPGVCFQLVKCKKCGLHFQNPRPVKDRISELYPKQYYSYTPHSYKPKKGIKSFGVNIEKMVKRAVRQAFFGYPCFGGDFSRFFLKVLLWPLWLRMRLLGKDLKLMPYSGQGRFLDIGCGSGRELLYQREFGLKVSGIELNESAAKIARECYGLDVRCGFLEEANFPESSFDVVHLSHVLEHVSDPVSTLKEIRRILSPEGIVAIKVPNIDSFSFDRFGTYWLGLDLPRHLYHFSKNSLISMLRKCGFYVGKTRQDIGAWGVWRESHRFEARDRLAKELPDSRFRNWIYKWKELSACMFGRGSVLVFYARPILSDSHK